VYPPADRTPTPESAAAAPGHAPDAEVVPRGRLFWLASLTVVVADQLAKALIRARLPLYDSVPVIPNFMDFVHVPNTGVAFGVLNEVHLPFKAATTVLMAGLALVGIGLYARHVRRDETLARLGLSFVLGGAVGNLIDRLHAGYVLDFVDVYWRNWHFWAFNVADSAITVGAILVFAELLLVTRHASRSV
jgi:signal peptidase II